MKKKKMIKIGGIVRMYENVFQLDKGMCVSGDSSQCCFLYITLDSFHVLGGAGAAGLFSI
jgi:hypothetical protein